MRAEYIFYVTDESFSFGDFPGSTIYQIENHGFSIDINSDNDIDISSIDFFGDYKDREIKTLNELLEFLQLHIFEVEEINENSQFSNIELFEELLEIIQENISKEIQENRRVA